MKTVASKSNPVRERDAERTRAAILAAAADIFARSGPAGARVDAIAAAAGVNKALLYYYFKDKEGLYQAVIENDFEAFNHDALKLLAEPGSARAVLLRYVDMHFDFICRKLRYASLYQQMMHGGGKPLERIVKKYLMPRSQAVGALLERGMRAGEFRKMDRMNASVSIVSLIVFYFSAGPVTRLIGGEDPYSRKNLNLRRKEMKDFIRHGLFAKPEAPIP